MSLASHADAAAGFAQNDMILTFWMHGERFALAVSMVNEILDPMEETPVPNAPPLAPALLNVRGAVVPLIDLRHALGLAPAGRSDAARLIVIDAVVAGELTRLAISVDAVEDVIEADRATIETIPDLGARWPREFIEGVARHGEDLVILLKTETLFDLFGTHPNRLAGHAKD